jgi:hypothetical protein
MAQGYQDSENFARYQALLTQYSNMPRTSPPIDKNSIDQGG